MQCDRIHAAEMSGEVETKLAVQVQWRFAIRLGRERHRPAATEFAAQFDVIVDLGIGDQRCAVRLIERLVACRQVNDGEAGLRHPDIARAVSAIAIGTAVAQRRRHPPQRLRRRRSAVLCHQPGNPTHQSTTRSKNSR